MPDLSEKGIIGDLRNDEHVLYNKNRQIVQEGFFKDGRLWYGQWFKYNEDGYLVCIELYEKGECIGDAETED